MPTGGLRVKLTAGLDDLKSLFQPKWFCDSLKYLRTLTNSGNIIVKIYFTWKVSVKKILRAIAGSIIYYCNKQNCLRATVKFGGFFIGLASHRYTGMTILIPVLFFDSPEWERKDPYKSFAQI